MIHCREAFSDLIEILKNPDSGLRRNDNIIHFFTGTVDEARALLDLGFSFTFGGAITFPPRKGQTENQYHGLIRMIPIEKILSETDAPYVAPMPHRGKRNEPAFVIEVVKKLAELKNISTDRMAAQIRENAKRIFGV
jgi:TatD DNase family protein